MQPTTLRSSLVLFLPLLQRRLQWDALRILVHTGLQGDTIHWAMLRRSCNTVM